MKKPARGATINPRRQPNTRNKQAIGALSTPRAGWFNRLTVNHRNAMHSARQQLSKSWTATLITTLVIAIALSLPAGLHVFLKNAERFFGNLDYAAQISLFLHSDTREVVLKEFNHQLSNHPKIERYDYIAPDAALKTLQQATGVEGLDKALPNNPLPHTFILYPNTQETEALQLLLLELDRHPAVESAQLETEWITRLQAFVELLSRLSAVISAFLIAGVLLVIGNTIRLLSHQYRDEITISKLVGATNRYVKRPFLYTGFIFGLFGSLLAGLLINAALLLLDEPISRLISLYQAELGIVGLTLADFAVLLLTGVLIGYGGAWLAVTRFLKEVI